MWQFHDANGGRNTCIFLCCVILSTSIEGKKFDIHVCRASQIYFHITANKMQRFLIYLLLYTDYMLQVVPLPIIRTHNCTYSFRYCKHGHMNVKFINAKQAKDYK